MATPAFGTQVTLTRSLSPSFPGLVRAELYKMWAQWTTRVLLGLLVALTFAPYVLLFLVPGTKNAFRAAPMIQSFSIVEVALSILRVFGGIALLIITARAIGLEYQQGTIRILLARGVGRMQLLTAKLAGVTLLAIAMVVASVMLNTLLYLFQFGVIYGAGDQFSTLTSNFWASAWAYFLTVLVSMAASILLAACVAVVGRSLSFGVSVALSWFAADNFATLILVIVYGLTKNDFWLKMPAYFLGPILNQLPSAYVPALTTSITTAAGAHFIEHVDAGTIGLTPYVAYDATHAFLVVLAYCAAFVAIAYFPTWRRDVLE